MHADAYKSKMEVAPFLIELACGQTGEGRFAKALRHQPRRIAACPAGKAAA